MEWPEGCDRKWRSEESGLCGLRRQDSALAAPSATRRAWLHSPCSQSGNMFRSPYLIPSPMLPATSIAPWPERGVDAASTLGGCRTIVSRLSCGRPSGLKAAPRGQVSRACCSCRHHVGPRAVPARSAWPGRRSAQTSACWCAPPAATGDRSRSACLGNTPSRCAPPFHQSSGGAGMIRPPDASGQQAGFRAGFQL